MADPATQETIDQWHRRFAVECNNRAWDLISKADRAADDDRDMLYLAYAAAYHWSKIGAPVNDARAEVTLAHVLALLGHGQQALHYARRCLAYFESHASEDWDVAFAHAEMAHAAAAAGDARLHARHYAEAKQRGEAIKEEEDRRIFMDELARIPSEVKTS